MSMSRHVLTREDVTAVVGPVEDATATAILACRPTQEELVEAFAWAAGDPEPLVAAGKALTGRVADLYEILAADQGLADEGEEI